MNRLKLDFTLKTNEERNNFVSQYLTSLTFTPTSEELETIANYILWGKDPITNLNPKQTKEIQLESRNKTWDAHPIESLDALLENPTFSETFLNTDPTFAPTKITKPTFSRSQTRREAPPDILQQYEELWQQIDEIDLIINYYDLAHGKRKNPPRPTLLQRFTPTQISKCQEKSTKLSQYRYLRLRHLLVELRRQQFALRDSYTTPIYCVNQVSTPIEPPSFNVEILSAPIDVDNSLLFPKDRLPLPEDFTQSQIKQIIENYWQRHRQLAQTPPHLIFDFCNMQHVHNALLLREDIEQDSPSLFTALDYYIKIAKLSEIHKEIFHLKLSHVKNQDIADYINPKYSKSYTANYISTIFCQKILGQITEAARQHEEVILNLPFPENFKCCRSCGQRLLIGSDNFVRKGRSADGFSNRCKRCDKEVRDGKKIK